MNGRDTVKTAVSRYPHGPETASDQIIYASVKEVLTFKCALEQRVA